MDVGHLAVASAIGNLVTHEDATLVHSDEIPGLVRAVLTTRGSYFLVIARYDRDSLNLQIERFSRRAAA